MLHSHLLAALPAGLLVHALLHRLAGRIAGRAVSRGSVWVAVISLVFLVVVHKLEYVLNAHIVGVEINAAAWEILAALFVCEAAFGVSGVIVAPIVYAYAKQELRDRGLV